MKPLLVRFWPYGPLLVTAAGAVWYSTWPWIAGLAACGLAAWAWELERRRELPPLPRRRLPGLPTDGEPLSGEQELHWDFIVAGYVDDAPEPVYPQDGGER